MVVEVVEVEMLREHKKVLAEVHYMVVGEEVKGVE
jgi:hypothetical protein